MASVQDRGNGSFFLVIEAGRDANGKRIRHTKTIKADGIRQARKILAEFEVEVLNGLYVKPSKMPFQEFVNEWRNKYALKELAPKTLSVRERYLKTRIIPHFGKMRLDEIETFHIVKFLSDAAEGDRLDGKSGGLASGSIQMLHRTLKNIFGRAVEWKILKVNPMPKEPKVRHRIVEPYDDKELAALFDALQTEDDLWRVMITLTISTGLRLGEVNGLQWRDIDLVNGTLQVRRTLSSAKDGKPIVTEPKTANSKRIISLSASMTQELRDYRKLVHEQLGRWKEPSDFYVFCNIDGKPFHPETPYLHFRSFLKKHGLRHIRFHDLRHLSATLLIQSGIHAKIISERLGHSNIGTTMNIYGHALRQADQAAADALDNVLPLRQRNVEK